jgi:hypothetical protein
MAAKELGDWVTVLLKTELNNFVTRQFRKNVTPFQ